jgi:hypothetical protein
VDYLPPADEHNPYAAPKSSLGPEKASYGFLGDVPIQEPNPSAKVRYDILGEAWGLFKQRMGAWITMTLIAGIVFLGIYAVVMVGGMAVIGGLPGQQQGPPSPGASIGIQFAQTLIITVIGAFFTAGLFRAAIKQVRGLPIGVADLFGVGDVLGSVIVASILTTLAVYAGLILCIIPGIYIGARLSLTIPLIADGRLKATEAMGMSWRALKGQVFAAFIFAFIVGIVAELGLIACLVGGLFTVPLYPLSYAILYRDFFLSGPPAGDSPWITTKPEVAPDF